MLKTIMPFIPKYNPKLKNFRPAYSTGSKLYFLDASNDVKHYGLYRNCKVLTDRGGYAFVSGDYIETDKITCDDVRTFLNIMRIPEATYVIGDIKAKHVVYAHMALVDTDTSNYVVFKSNGQLKAIDYTEDTQKEYGTTYTQLKSMLVITTKEVTYRSTLTVENLMA